MILSRFINQVGRRVKCLKFDREPIISKTHHYLWASAGIFMADTGLKTLLCCEIQRDLSDCDRLKVKLHLQIKSCVSLSLPPSQQILENAAAEGSQRGICCRGCGRAEVHDNSRMWQTDQQCGRNHQLVLGANYEQLLSDSPCQQWKHRVLWIVTFRSTFMALCKVSVL